MTVKRGKEILSTPGPTNIPNRVLSAMHRPAIDFSGPEFIALAQTCFQDIKKIFKTEHDVLIYAANGHGAWEAALSNVLSPGDKVITPETGNFALSWADMAGALGIDVEILPKDWRRAIDPEQVRERLAADKTHEIKAILAVHTDTATSVTSNIPALRKVLDELGHPALLMVDTIASLGTVEFEMDAWGVDVAVAASQKGLMMSPGLGLVGAGPKAREAEKSCTMPRRYWDWSSRLDPAHYRRFCGTAPEHLVFGLRESIDMLLEETLEGAFARHARIAEAVRRTVIEWGEAGAIELNAVEPSERSNAVTTVLVDEKYDAAAFREIVRENFQVSLGGGLGKYQGRAFRIGHMGDFNEMMALAVLSSVEAGLQIAGIPHKKGGIQAAIDCFGQNPLVK